MTEAAAATPEGGTQGVQDGAPVQGLDTSEASPFAGMDETLIGDLTQMGIKDVDGGLKALVEKQKFIDSTQRFPGTDDPDKLKEFFGKIAPEGLDAYPDPDLTKFAEDVPFDQDGYDAFKELAHKYNLQPYQFEGIINDYIPQLGQAGERAQLALDEKAAEAKTALIEEMGGEASEAFIEAAAKVNALAEQVPELVDMLSEIGAIDGDGRVMHPGAFKTLIKLAEVAGVGTNAKLDTSKASTTGDVGIDPETGIITDATKAGEFFKSDPEGYARMTGKP